MLTVSSFPCFWWTSNALSRRVQGRRLENSGWGRVDKRTLQTHVCISVRPSRFLRNKATSWHSGCDGIRARAQAQLRNPLEKSQLKGNEGPQGSRPKNNPRVNCKSKSLAVLIYNYIYIYIYVYICYVQKTEISGTLNHISPPSKCNCSSTVGTVLGYTCRITGKRERRV